MNTPHKAGRLWWMTVLLSASFCGLGYRLVDLQVLQHDELRLQAQANTHRSYFREPRRGDIRDCRGNLMAVSKPVKTVCADPTLICNQFVNNHQEDMAAFLSPLLQMPKAELLELLQIRMITNHQGHVVPDKYVILKRKVKVEDWENIQTKLKDYAFGIEEKNLPRKARPHYRNLRRRAIFAEDAQLREYPNKKQASQVLGYVGVQERKTNHGWIMETAGKEGLEQTVNATLTGIRGWRVTEQDERRQELVVFREQDVAPRPGLNVVVTLDLGMQNILETALAGAMQKHAPISASGIVARPKTGEILAMAALPNFDPNQPGEYLPDFRRNRTITDLAEPGSTFKVVAVAGALNEHVVSLGNKFNCENGRFFYAGRLLHDHDAYGILSVEQIITKSSNIGAAKVALALGEARLHSYVRNFGFGRQTGIPLPAERMGTVHALTNWNKLSITRVAMGHEVAVTQLQMVMAMCAIANGGKLMCPMLIDRVEDEQNQVVARYQPQVARQLLNPEAARQMVAALKTVAGTNGTASKARLENYQVAGKTGTAQKAGPNGYIPGKYYSSFIGFFPADNPELCISVVLDEPRNGYYGGQTAAPTFREIAEKAANYLNIRPEFMVGEEMTASAKPHGGRSAN